MPKFAFDLLDTLDMELNVIAKDNNSLVYQAEKSLSIIRKKILELKKDLVDFSFISADSEIKYFKETHPVILSRLFYFKEILLIESNKPPLIFPDKVKRNLKRNIKQYKKFFSSYNRFYQYYKGKCSHLDSKYFVRSENDDVLPDDCLLVFDYDFTTGYDIILARFMAYEKIIDYINCEISKINNFLRIPDMHPTRVSASSCKWSGSNTALVELVYALKSCDCINNGNVEIKDIVSTIESAFNVKINDYYRTYNEIKCRSERTKFMDTIKASLLKKMSEEDN